jgi:septal ring factor EnvC (AmiA/AmiB activator)
LVVMKDKAPIIVLIIVAVGLGFALVVVNSKARREKEELSDALSVQSNTVISIKASLTEQQAVNQVLETNLTATRVDYSNKLALSDASLRTTEENLEKARTEAKAKADADAAQLALRDAKISDLEARNLDLDKQDGDLRDHISGLQAQITATEAKLARSEGDRSVLLRDLKRLQAEKAAWEERFSDLAYLKVHVRLLKMELAEQRRFDLMRHKVYASAQEKGAQRLTTPPVSSSVDAVPSLEVELHHPGHTNALVTPLPAGTTPK